MKDTTISGLRAVVVAIAPAVMLAGLVYHPFIANLTDTAAVAAAAGEDTFRWAVAHLLVGVGSGLLALAFLAVRAWLREAGEERFSAVAIPFVIMGATLYAILPGMEFTVLAAVEIGADVAAAQAAIDAWFLPLLLSAAVIFAVGILGFAMAIARSGVLTPPLTALVAGALVVMAVAHFVPLGLFQFYVNGLAGILALWPLAYAIRTRAATAAQPRAMQAD